MENDCKFRKECAQHSSAGEYREESGFSPELYRDSRKGVVHCISIEREPSEELGKSEIPKGYRGLGNGYTPAKEIPELHMDYKSKFTSGNEVNVDTVSPKPLTITIENGNYEQLQELIVNLGGCFMRKDKLENMTLNHLIAMLTPNVKETTHINFKLTINKK